MQKKVPVCYFAYVDDDNDDFSLLRSAYSICVFVAGTTTTNREFCCHRWWHVRRTGTQSSVRFYKTQTSEYDVDFPRNSYYSSLFIRPHPPPRWPVSKRAGNSTGILLLFVPLCEHRMRRHSQKPLSFFVRLFFECRQRWQVEWSSHPIARKQKGWFRVL